MNISLVPFKVRHQRISPKLYDFTHGIFWFKLDLLSDLQKTPWFISYNRFNIFSFYDVDHIKFSKETSRNNYLEYLKINGVESRIVSLHLYTQFRCFGYVFNPVSFIIAKDEDDNSHAIIEVGNTFNELKPYYVSPECFNGEKFKYSTVKNYYISPFLDLDNEMVFNFQSNDNKIKIHVDDMKKGERVLQVWLEGEERDFSYPLLLKESLKSPFITLKIIFLIHYHAFRLWLMGIRYFKKEEHKELQIGAQKWKK